MARAKGRDVILDLMDSVAKLESLSSEQTERFEGLATHVAGMTARMTAMATQVVAMATQMTAMATQMTAMTTEMAGMGTQVTALTHGARATEQQLGRVARLLVQLANDHQRIEGLEERVGKLERKAG